MCLHAGVQLALVPVSGPVSMRHGSHQSKPETMEGSQRSLRVHLCPHTISWWGPWVRGWHTAYWEVEVVWVTQWWAWGEFPLLSHHTSLPSLIQLELIEETRLMDHMAASSQVIAAPRQRWWWRWFVFFWTNLKLNILFRVSFWTRFVRQE